MNYHIIARRTINGTYHLKYNNNDCKFDSIFTVTDWLVVFSTSKRRRLFQMDRFFKPQLKSKWWVLLIFAILYYFFYNFDFTQLIAPETLEYIESSASVSANVFAGIGIAAILPAFIENFIANGVAEEILYRGFCAKTLHKNRTC